MVLNPGSSSSRQITVVANMIDSSPSEVFAHRLQRADQGKVDDARLVGPSFEDCEQMREFIVITPDFLDMQSKVRSLDPCVEDLARVEPGSKSR